MDLASSALLDVLKKSLILGLLGTSRPFDFGTLGLYDFSTSGFLRLFALSTLGLRRLFHCWILKMTYVLFLKCETKTYRIISARKNSAHANYVS